MNITYRKMEKVAALPRKRVLPGHHSLDISPDLPLEIKSAFQKLQAEGKLRHGSGTHTYGSWAVMF